MARIPVLSCLSILTTLSVCQTVSFGPPTSASTIAVNDTPPAGAGIPLEGFVSFSIEFSSFPDFAGNVSNPNAFSNNLLNNLGNLTGTKPFIRVGGNTQYVSSHSRPLVRTKPFLLIGPSL